MGNTTVQMQTTTLNKLRSIKLSISVKQNKTLSYDDIISLLADKFLAEIKK